MNLKNQLEELWREAIKQRQNPITIVMGKTLIRQILQELYGKDYTKRNILNFYRDHWVGAQTFEF